MAPDFDRQVAELQVRIAVLNGYTPPGISVSEALGSVHPGKGNPGHQPMCATEPRAPTGERGAAIGAPRGVIARSGRNHRYCRSDPMAWG